MIDLSLPYITAELNGTGGEIKQTPEHFIVEEIPLYKPIGKGVHLYINITKRNLTTRDVQRKLAKLFNVSIKNIGYAGLKDKFSVATQTFSILVNNKDSVNEIISNIRDFKVNWYKFHTNKLRIGHLLGNKFIVTITNLKDPENALKNAKKIISKLKQIGLPNFYGEQRVNEKNVEQGLAIIKGVLKIKNKWLKKYLISCYQGYLCNRYLVKRIETGNFTRLLKGDIAKKYDTGGMFVVNDVEKEQKRYENHEISFTCPVYGIKMWYAEDKSKELEDQVINESDISMTDLKKQKIKGTRRLGRILIPDLDARLNNNDIIVSFSLPKGAFATIVLREIMK